MQSSNTGLLPRQALSTTATATPEKTREQTNNNNSYNSERKNNEKPRYDLATFTLGVYS